MLQADMEKKVMGKILDTVSFSRIIDRNFKAHRSEQKLY